jgi:hypothetical protein
MHLTAAGDTHEVQRSMQDGGISWFCAAVVNGHS